MNQVITFGVHPNATSCRIGWFQPARAPGFDVVNTGVTLIHQLNLGSLPWDQAVSLNGANVTWENVEPLFSEKKVGVADFTFWDEMDVEDVHGVGGIECNQSSLAFLADLDGNYGEHGGVTMMQSAVKGSERGWYVSYCLEQ